MKKIALFALIAAFATSFGLSNQAFAKECTKGQHYEKMEPSAGTPTHLDDYKGLNDA